MDQNNQSNGYVLKSKCAPTSGACCHGIATAPICSHADESAPFASVKYSSPMTAEGARHVYVLIERAANPACGTSSTDIEVINGSRPLCASAISHAIHDIKNPNLAQVYIEKNGRVKRKNSVSAAEVITAKK